MSDRDDRNVWSYLRSGSGEYNDCTVILKRTSDPIPCAMTNRLCCCNEFARMVQHVANSNIGKEDMVRRLVCSLSGSLLDPEELEGV